MTRPSILLIESRQPDNHAIGTGFVVGHDDEVSYLVTCAHVILDVGGPEQVRAAGQPARVVALGEHNGLDLAVLQVARLDGRAPLHLRSGGSPKQAVTIEGYYKYVNYRALEMVEGHLERSFKLSDTGQHQFVPAWYIAISDQQRLLGGYSGSPVCDAATGEVIAVTITRDGDQQGRAISIAALPIIWPDLPANLRASITGSSASAIAPVAPAPVPSAPTSTSEQHAAPVGLIQLGSGNSIGNITIGDVAGRDIVKTTFTVGSTESTQPRSVAVFLAAHQRLKGQAPSLQGETLIDWSREFSTDDPPNQIWSQQLIPDLERHLHVFRRNGQSLIALRAFARNSAALAFGYVFCQRAGFHIHYSDNRGALWRTDEPAGAASPIVRDDTIVSSDSRDILLELAITQSVERIREPIDEWLQGAAAPVGRRVLLTLNRDPRDITAVEGAAIARQVCSIISDDVRPRGVAHLFGALPMGIALLIGWGLKAHARVQAYELDSEDSYRPTCLLRG